MINEIDTTERGGSRSAPDVAQMVGRHYRFRDFYEVGREKIREYARAVQDFHPAHWDEGSAAALGYSNLVAPLTFISLVGLRKIFDEVEIGYDLSQVLHTDQVIEYHEPITAGDRLTCDCYLESFRQMAGTDIIVLKNLVSNQHGRLLQTTLTTVVARASADIDTEMTDAVRGIMMHSQVVV